MYYVYILECKDGSLYTGTTNDLKRRFREHKNKIGGHYTASHGAKQIVYKEKFKTKGLALRREAEIKRYRRNKKIKLI